jgi:predicted ATPase/DNA-binding SARP family transcriptional activator
MMTASAVSVLAEDLGVVMNIRILGPVEVWAQQHRLDLGGRRQLAVFAFLVLHSNRAVSRDALIEAVWGSQRSSSDNRLSMAVARLRKALEPLDSGGEPRLRTVSGGYMLSLAPGELDAWVFAERVREGRGALGAGDPARASELLGAALGLWGGPPLAEVAFEDFAQAEIRRLEELRLEAIEVRVEAELALGRHAQLVGELEGLVVEQPGRERVASLLMLTYYRCGRQGDALEVYQRTRSYLAEELGLEPGPALRALQTQILEQAPLLAVGDADAGAGVSSVRRRAARLPIAPTPTVGREREIEELSGLLVDPEVRLVTLTGPGGVGKTRLALASAHTASAAFEDGACWVELAGVTRPDDVGSTIVRTLAVSPVAGESPQDALVRHLSSKRLLLVVDNFEHVIAAAELVGELVNACGRLKALVTSREALRLTAEHRFAVEPLAVPEMPERAMPAEVERAGATALFIAAARRQGHRFSVGRNTAPSVARVCARLDGLPLAIELAAGRMALFGIEELAARFERELDVLGEGPRNAPARQQTLRATIDWSYGLLDPEQANAFVRLAVFAGGATSEAAQAITDASLETLEALIAKSLIARRNQGGSVRLVMLDTIREYALERLARDPQREEVEHRYFEHYLQLAEQAWDLLSTHEEHRGLAALDLDVNNVRAALQWAIKRRPERALRLAGRLGPYWFIRGDPESLPWLDAALDAAGEKASAADRGQAQLQRQALLFARHQEDAARDALKKALALFEQAGDHAGMAEALCNLAALASYDAEPDQAWSYMEAACREARLADVHGVLGRTIAMHAVFGPPAERVQAQEEAATLLAERGDYRNLALLYSNSAYAALVEDQPSRAMHLLDLARQAASRIDSPVMSMIILGNLGLAELFTGNLSGARQAFQDQLRLCQGHAFHIGADEGLTGLAAITARDGDSERAANLFGAARAIGSPAIAHQSIYDRLERDYFAPARAAFGELAWRHAQEIGGTLSYDRAIAYALENTAEPPAQ